MGRKRRRRERHGLERDTSSSMDAVQPDFRSSPRSTSRPRTNLEELDNEHIRESLTTLMLTVSERATASAPPWPNTASPSRGGKGVGEHEDHGPQRLGRRQRCRSRKESDVMIITENGKVIRVHANEIREAGRSTQGVRLLRSMNDDTVAAAAVLQEEEAERKEVTLGVRQCAARVSGPATLAK